MTGHAPSGIRGGGNTYSDYSSGAMESGVPGGGENTHSWRHGEIVAAFAALEVTDALTQADRFEQIALWWDDGLHAFRHAVDGSLALAWSGVAAAAAGSAVESYVARAHDLTLALEELPGVVRAAAEAIVATRHAVGSPVVEESDATAWSVSRAVHATGSASAQGAASAAEEDARAAMRQRYVLPFAELVTRIPLLPMPLRSFDSDATGDRQMLIGASGQSRGERRTQPSVEIATSGAANETTATGVGSAPHEAIGDSETMGRDGRETDVPNDGSEEFDNLAAEPDDGAAGSDTATAVISTSTAATGMTQPGGTAALTAPGGSGLLTAPMGTSGAAIDPSADSTRHSPSAGSEAGRAGSNVNPSGARGRTPGGSAQYRPPGQREVSRPGIGNSIPGSTGPVIGADPPSGHNPTRSGDRYFHCGGALPTAPGVDAVRGLPEYLITLANTAELLGEPRPAIAGGVIGGGDDFSPGEQRSSATRG